MLGKRKKKYESESGKNIGLVMTVSLFLIILTFFILLNSIAVIDDNKKRVAIGSLIGSFGSLPGGLSALRTGDSIMPHSAPLTEQNMDFERLMEEFNIDITSKQIKTTAGKDSVLLTIGEDALFFPNTHKLKPYSEAVLTRLADFIKEGNYQVEIIGHTDSRAAEEKGYRSNRELSCLMALEVQKYFIEIKKVEAGRINAYGYDSLEAAASNNTSSSREKNRRIEMILHFNAPLYTKRLYDESPAGIFTHKRFTFRLF